MKKKWKFPDVIFSINSLLLNGSEPILFYITIEKNENILKNIVICHANEILKLNS